MLCSSNRTAPASGRKVVIVTMKFIFTSTQSDKTEVSDDQDGADQNHGRIVARISSLHVAHRISQSGKGARDQIHQSVDDLNVKKLPEDVTRCRLNRRHDRRIVEFIDMVFLLQHTRRLPKRIFIEISETVEYSDDRDGDR